MVEGDLVNIKLSAPNIIYFNLFGLIKEMGDSNFEKIQYT